MEDKRIIELVQRSLKSLFKEDWFLLYYAVNERSVMHKFAEHLQKRFRQYGYVVDCEYNNDNAWGTKINSGKMRKHYNGSRFTPDIIIHRRTLEGDQTNEHNICIIEIKLSTNVDENGRIKEDDYLSFATLTQADTLVYQLGIYIELWAGDDTHLTNNVLGKNIKAFTVYKDGTPCDVNMKTNIEAKV